MKPERNVVLRGGIADGETLYVGDIGSPLEWEDTGGGATTFVFADETETLDGATMFVYRVAR